MPLSDDIHTLQFEIAEIDLKLKAAGIPVEERTAADKRYFSRLLAGLKRRRAKLKALQPQYGW